MHGHSLSRWVSMAGMTFGRLLDRQVILKEIQILHGIRQ